MEFNITLVIVILTVLVSIRSFGNKRTEDDLIFYPPAIRRGQYYRFFSHGFIHGDIPHLVFNMYALFSFGGLLEDTFKLDCLFGERGKLFFLILYLTGIIVASLPDYFRYKDSFHFRSLGASGAISAVIFSMVVLFPKMGMGLIFLPNVEVPAYIFAVLYLGITVYLDRRGGSRINHSAHFWGAAYGIVFTLVFSSLFSVGFDAYDNFIEQMKSTDNSLTLICSPDFYDR